MTLKKLASEITKREGLKSHVKIGDVREVLAILSDLIWQDYEEDANEMTLTWMLIENGRNRARRKKKK